MAEGVNVSKTREIVRDLLPFMAKKGIPITPNNYRIWFEYFLDRNDDIKKQLDELLEKGAEFTSELNRELYERFFVRDVEKEVNEKIQKEMEVTDDTSARARDLILNTIKDVMENSEDTSQFGKQLKKYTDDANKIKKPEDVQDMLVCILRDTSEVEVKSSKLQKKLNKSSEKLEGLHTEIIKAKEEARIDSLTGLHNRRFFDEILIEQLDLIKNQGGKCSFVIMDIDYFKRFNDTYGHLLGDKVLQTVAKEIEGKSPENAFVCRYGGEEFAIICPGAGLNTGFEIAEKIRLGMVNDVEFYVRSMPVEITLSAGVSEFLPDDTPNSVIDRADRALYLAKYKGRNNTKTEQDTDAKIAEH